jgi:hypothetical protein
MLRRFRLICIKSRRGDHPCRFMFLQGFVGSHERDKRAELVLREKSIKFDRFRKRYCRYRPMELRESYRQLIKKRSI